jgi:hypothetical protein
MRKTSDTVCGDSARPESHRDRWHIDTHLEEDRKRKYAILTLREPIACEASGVASEDISKPVAGTR